MQSAVYSGDEKRKIFVGGLAPPTNNEALRLYFSHFGEVQESVVMTNGDTGQSRGFGFVTFDSQAAVQRVLNNIPHLIDGKHVDAKVCNPRGKGDAKPDSNDLKIFIGGLPANCSEESIKSFFTFYGNVVECVLMMDQNKERHRGFGFVTFESQDAVNRLCMERYVVIGGKKVECKLAQPLSGRRMPPTGQQRQIWPRGPGQGYPMPFYPYPAPSWNEYGVPEYSPSMWEQQYQLAAQQQWAQQIQYGQNIAMEYPPGGWPVGDPMQTSVPQYSTAQGSQPSDASYGGNEDTFEE